MKSGEARNDKRGSERFGQGEFGEAEYNLHIMRSVFINTVNRFAPEFGDELESEMLELYQQIPLFYYEADEYRRKAEEDFKLGNNEQSDRLLWVDNCRPPWGVIEEAWNNRQQEAPFEICFTDYYAEFEEDGGVTYFGGELPLHKDPKIKAFVEKIFEWSRRHNLDADWCRAIAYETLDLWCQRPSLRDSRIFAYPGWRIVPVLFAPPAGRMGPGRIVDFHGLALDRPIYFSFSYETYYPEIGFRQEVREKIIEAFKKELEAFLDECDQKAKEAGLVQPLRKLDKTHFEWLILHRIKRPYLTCEQIYRLHKDRGRFEDLRIVNDVRAVQKAVKELTEKLGLPPHYVGRGRRPKALHVAG